MKKIATALCAFALALALPVSAFAAGSPEYTEVNGGLWYDDATNTYYANGIEISGDVVIYGAGSTNSIAKNVPSSNTVIASFYIDGDIYEGTSTVSLFVGADYVGKTVGVWVEHGDGTTTALNLVVNESGYITLNMSKFSIITVTEEAVPGVAPKTGIDNTGIALATTGALIMAGGAAFLLRKKVAE